MQPLQNFRIAIHDEFPPHAFEEHADPRLLVHLHVAWSPSKGPAMNSTWSPLRNDSASVKRSSVPWSRKDSTQPLGRQAGRSGDCGDQPLHPPCRGDGLPGVADRNEQVSGEHGDDLRLGAVALPQQRHEYLVALAAEVGHGDLGLPRLGLDDAPACVLVLPHATPSSFRPLCHNMWCGERSLRLACTLRVSSEWRLDSGRR